MPKPRIRKRNKASMLSGIAALVLLVSWSPVTAEAKPESQPNIVLILADDLGYGDLGCYNAESKIATPNLDRLAAQGLRFTDAHAPGSLCVPSRYGLLTGRYPFRGNLDWRRKAVIDDDRLTLASLLQQNGYATAMVGKWHLGFDGGPDYDWSKPLEGGPVDRGFDSFFGMPASLDIPPYYYIRDDRPVAPPTEKIGDNHSKDWTSIQGAFWRGGGIAPGFKHKEVLPRFTEEAVKYVDSRGEGDATRPFFLYVALTAPHTPWLPLEKFEDKSEAAMYGDFAMQVDATVGKILDALEANELSKDTLVIFTSDNGPVWYPQDVERFDHSSVGPLRGMKADAWEGGHRMPLIVRWPEKVEPATTTDQTFSFVDFMATFAAIAGTDLPEGAGEDSLNMLPVLLGQATSPVRTVTVFKQGATTIRDGDWKLIDHLGSGGFSQPRREKPEPRGPTGQLYNLKEDLGETNNRWQSKPEIVDRLRGKLKDLKSN